MQELGDMFKGSGAQGFRVQDSRSRAQGFRVQDSRSRVQG